MKGSSGDASAPPPPPTRRDGQRDALDTLVRLVKQCARDEAQIVKDFATSQEAANQTQEQAIALTTKKYDDLETAVRDFHSNKVMEADKKFEWSRDDISAKAKNTKLRIVHDHDQTGKDVKEKLDQAMWLADSVLEAAEIRVKEEYKKAKEKAEAAAKTIEELAEQGTARMIALGQSAPPAPPDVPETPETAADPAAEFQKYEAVTREQLDVLSSLKLPGMGLAVFAGKTRKKVAETYDALRAALTAAERAAQAMISGAEVRQQVEIEAAIEKRKQDIQKAKDTLNPVVEQSSKKRDAQVQALRTEANKRLADVEKQRDAIRAKSSEWKKKVMPRIRDRREKHLQAIRDRHDAAMWKSQCDHDAAKAELERTWTEGLAQIRQPIGEQNRGAADWKEIEAHNWVAPKKFAETIRFGEIQVDIKKIVETFAPGAPFTLPLPDAFSLPALLAFPRQCSLLLHHDPAGRNAALQALQLVMARLLTGLPPGRARFTIIDPAGLGQNFAAFTHLFDFGDALAGARIWTTQDQIEQRLADLTEHMETVIQKYLRNEFETIDQYNAQAGELAEPYRFLVIADFPAEFEADSLRRLASIASTGSRCGVYTLIARDTRLKLPSGSHFDDVEAHSVNLVQRDGKFVWKDEVFKQFPLTLDPPPPEETLTNVLQIVGKGAIEASRIEVPFESITPKGPQIWSQNSASEFHVPVGRMGATRLQQVRLGRGVAQHALIAGKTGSGKSSLLNALITNTALWYPPDQVVMYLIDFKKGVEFKTYATHNLPHAKAIAVESDREFGLSVLQRIDAELTSRGDLYRKLGVQDLAAYRGTPNAAPMPRTLLIIDEFQEFFSEDDKVSQEANQLLERLVRQGRAFGIHVLLGSQTLAGSGGLSRSTVGQMGVRVALQCSDADSQLILGDNNSAARLLSRPGEAIYNDAGGLVEGNSPFQVAWLPDDKREEALKIVHERAKSRLQEWDPPIVFEGNSAAPIIKNIPLAKLLDAPSYPPPPAAPVAWLGDPVAIKSPTAVPFRRQSGANVLMIGQQEENAMAMIAACLASLAAQYPPGGAKFYIMDGSAVDSPLAKVLPAVKAVLPHEIQMVDYRTAPDAIAELAAEQKKRQAVDPGSVGTGGSEIFCLIYGIQRYRMLRKQEENYSFSSGDEEKKPDPGAQFAELLREGPHVGIHVIAWSDTPASVDRTLERTAMREFDFRVLFQMSANDSSNLIDSPAANKLGSHRALVYSEEQGTMEKFRPYALPDKEWLERIRGALAGKKTSEE